MQPSDLWKFVNSKRGSSRIPCKVHDDVSEYSHPKTIVDAFARSFSNSFSQSVPLRMPNNLSCNSFAIPAILEKDLLNILSELNSKKSTAGEDQIPCFLVRDCRSVFVEPLLIICNLSLATGTFPNRWKRARITPVFKKGNKEFLGNYRPIAILNNFAKVFEQVIYLD